MVRGRFITLMFEVDLYTCDHECCLEDSVFTGGTKRSWMRQSGLSHRQAAHGTSDTPAPTALQAFAEPPRSSSDDRSGLIATLGLNCIVTGSQMLVGA